MKNIEVKGKKILAIETWWGLRNPGCNGYILTDDKKLYSYQEYDSRFNMNFDPKLNYCHVRDITDDEYQTILNWIDENIIGKDFEFRICMDMGNTICISYNNHNYVIKNHFDLYDDIENIIKK